MGLVAVELGLGPNNFTGGLVDDLDVQFLCTAEQTGVDAEDAADAVCVVGDRSLIAGSGDSHVIGIHSVNIGAQGQDVVVVVVTQRNRCVVVSLDLVFVVNSVVVSLGLNLVVVQVEDGSLAPVAIEAQEGSVQIDAISLGVVEGDEAFHINTVLEAGIHVCLIGSGQGQGHGDLCGLAGSDSDDTVLQRAILNGILGGVGQQITDFCYKLGIGGRQAFCHSDVADLVANCLVGQVLQVHAHGVDAGTLGVIAQLQLGLVDTVYIQVSGSGGSLQNVGDTSALLSGGIGVAVTVQSDGSGGHTQLVNHVANFGSGQFGVSFLDVLTDQNHDTAHIGSCHGSTAHFLVLAAGDGGQNVTTVSGDFGLQLQVGSGTPGGEVRHEGACLVVPVELDDAIGASSHNLAFVLTDGHGRDLGVVTNGHHDFAEHVIINNNCDSACFVCELDLLFEGDLTTADQSDLAGHVYAGVVDGHTVTGNGHVLKLSCLAFLDAQHLEEVILLSAGVNGLIEEDFLIAVCQHELVHVTVDRSNGQSGLEGGGSTDSCGVGVGSLVGVTVNGTHGAAVVVGSSNDQGDACSLDTVVQIVLVVIVGFTGETTGGTKAHVDGVNAQSDTVFQCGQDVAIVTASLVVAEHLHDCELGIDGNAGDGLVIAANDAGNVGAVQVVEGHDVGVLIGIVIAEDDLVLGDVTVVNFSCFHTGSGLVGLGLLQQAFHIGTVVSGIHYLMGSESGVGVVQAGIQDSDQGALTGVLNIGAVEDTGVVHVDGVLNSCGSFVGVGDGDTHNTLGVDDLLQLFVGGLDVGAVQNVGVLVLHLRDQTAAQHAIQDLILLRSQFSLQSLHSIGCAILFEGHLVVGAGVIAHQVVAGEGQDDTDFTGQLLLSNLVQQILVDVLQQLLLQSSQSFGIVQRSNAAGYTIQSGIELTGGVAQQIGHAGLCEAAEGQGLHQHRYDQDPSSNRCLSGSLRFFDFVHFWFLQICSPRICYEKMN